MIRSALMLCGSPKGERGSSWEFGSFLLHHLEARGVATRRRAITPSDTLLDDVREAELLILSFPLYADGIPARFKAALMEIARAGTGPKLCMALVQCGFLESSQNDCAIEMCRLFARDAGFVWLGGLGRGAGGMIEGKPLDMAPRPLNATRKALEITAAALAEGKPVPEEAQKAFAAPLIPRWIYSGAASLGFLFQALGNGRLFAIFRKPYR